MRTWSFSSLNTYRTCPKQYELTYVTPVIPYQETEATIWGSRVHKALEDYARDGAPLAEEFAKYQPYVDKILAMPGDKFFEQQFALTRNLDVCGFDDTNAWCRGIIDIGVVDGDRAAAFDYKTGKIRPDSDQLKLFAGFLFAHYPEVERVKTGYLWLKFNEVTTETYTRDDVSAIWRHFLGHASRLEKSYDKGLWLPKPSGLCRGWCGAKKHCAHWQPKR